VTGKGGKIDGFTLAKLSPVSLAALGQQAPLNPGPRPGGATTRLRYRRALNVSRGRPRPARGRPLSAHRGDLAAAENTCTGAILATASALPQVYPGPHHGHPSPRGATGDRGCGCAGRGVCRGGGSVAGVRVDVALSAVLGFLSATNPTAVKPLHDFLRITVPGTFMCADTLYPPRH
jgi:hypothetical protein